MAVTENTYTGDGSTVLFSFTFPYLDQAHVKVSLNGSDTTAFTFANATTVQLNSAPGVGVAVRVYRNSDADNVEATFFPGSAIRAGDLNDNFLQSLYLNQETRRIAQEASLGGIADGSIGTAKLATGAVTDVKIGTGAVTEAKIGTGAVTETKLGAGAVTNSKIAAGAVEATQLATDAVTNPKIATGAVNTDELASSAVTEDKIASSAVTEAKIASNAVTNSKLADNAVNTAEIADAAVTVAKLSAGAVGTGVGYVRDASVSLLSSDSVGYFVFQDPSGKKLLVQWGVAGPTSTSALTTVNFHTAFAANPSVQCIVTGIVFGNSRVAPLGSTSTTGFSYQVRDHTNNAQNNSIRWIAIGEAP